MIIIVSITVLIYCTRIYVPLSHTFEHVSCSILVKWRGMGGGVEGSEHFC
jgi:hypothetical protein